MSAIVLKRQTVLADVRRRVPLEEEPSSVVRVGNYEWPTVRDDRKARFTPAVVSPQWTGNEDPESYEWPSADPTGFPRLRRDSAGFSYVAGETRTGAAPEPWYVVTTTMSRDKQEEKQAIPVGSVVRFTVQNGLRDKDDDSDMAIVRGRVVATRSPLNPDSYVVQSIETVKTYKLDASIPEPPTNEVFLVAPVGVASIESIGSEAPPTFVIPSPTEFDAPALQLIPRSAPATPAAETAPAPQAPTAQPPAPAPTSSVVPWIVAGVAGAIAIIAIGAAILTRTV